MSILLEEVKRWFESEGGVGEYRQAVELLRRSRVLEFLRRIGAPSIIDYGESSDVMAGQAHFSAGYQTALDHLMYFERLFANQTKHAVLDPPDFGGVEEALRKGILRKEDLEKDKLI